MVKNCCVLTCKTVWNPYREISLFSFPWKNDALLEEWIKVLPTNRKITAHSRICSLHFNNESLEQKFGKRILKKDAIPTIFPKVVGNHSALLREEEDSTSLFPSCLTSPTTARDEENEVVPTGGTRLQGEAEMKSVATQVSPHCLKPTAREADLQRKVKVLQGQLRRREKKLLTMSRLINELKLSGTSSDTLEDILTSRLSGFHLELFRNQAKNSASGKTKRSYSDKMKEFASTVYFYSPKAYAYVRKQLIALPHEPAVRRWIAEYSCRQTENFGVSGRRGDD